MNILIKRQTKWKTFRAVVPAFLSVFIYSILKYVMITRFQKDASIIECNKIPIALFFEGKSQSSLYGIIFNLLLMKLLKYCTLETIIQAATKFVGKNYPDGPISKYERKRRNNVFKYFKTDMTDFIPAVLEYYKENPYLFTPVIPDQNDFESNGDNETNNLIN
ncbi:hypothetical protein ACTFIR_004199 [Dictyostelium discoideum]